MKRLAPLLLALAAAACVRAPKGPPPARADGSPPPPRPPVSGKFEGDFEARLRGADGHERFFALLDLTDRVDLPALAARLRSEHLDKRARRDAVVDALERTAERQQTVLRPALDRMLAAGRLDRVDSLAVVNRLVVRGRAEAILALSAEPQVSAVLPDWTNDDGTPPTSLVPDPSTLGERFTSWALPAMGAPALWAQGLDGKGVTVAAIDTGADAAHEQLASGRAAGARGWYDPVRGSEFPRDEHGHGTSVLSEAVGRNPAGRLVGVAPGATWAAALGNDRNRYSRVRASLAADWVLRVARPDVLVNAWSHDEEPCSRFDLPFIDAWKAAEIFVVFPAGNAGPGPATGEPPASLTGVFPGDRSVVAVGGSDPAGAVHPTSSRGPGRCGARTFPTFVAPGAALPYAVAGRAQRYATGTGTSLAAGLVAGAAALLLQADPEMSPDELEDVLAESCRDVPPRGPDDASGAGAIDLPAALARARAARDRRAVAARPSS
jgi:bacillopeptidase F